MPIARIICSIMIAIPLALCLFVSAQAQSSLPTGCPVPQSNGRTWYVDPVNGSMQNDGSAARPWHTFAEVMKAGLISSNKYPAPYQQGSAAQPSNPKGVVHAGDSIYLLSGDHGAAEILGYVNSDFITVQAAPGHSPVLSGLKLIGSSKWAFKGLTFQATRQVLPRANSYKLVYIAGNKFHGPTDHIYLAKNHILSAPDNVVAAWTNQDWLANGVDGVLFYGAGADLNSCTLTQTTIHNIKFGIGISNSRNIAITQNTIDVFADDGIDIQSVRDILIQQNRITNNRSLGDGNHNDMIQGQWNPRSPVLSQNIYINANLMVESTSPANFANYTNAYCQGIGVFDGDWQNFNVTNNFIVVPTWHGIALYGMNGATIVNNTVLSRFTGTNEKSFGKNPRNMTWIGVFNKKPQEGGNAPINVIVRNNVSMNFNLPPVVMSDHNTTAVIGTPTDPSRIFVKYDEAQASYDARPLPSAGNPIIGTGEASSAPRTDINGSPRRSPVDQGAYASK